MARMWMQMARLAKQLPQGTLQSQAAELGFGAKSSTGGVAAADLDEDDLT